MLTNIRLEVYRINSWLLNKMVSQFQNDTKYCFSLTDQGRPHDFNQRRGGGGKFFMNTTFSGIRNKTQEKRYKIKKRNNTQKSATPTKLQAPRGGGPGAVTYHMAWRYCEFSQQNCERYIVHYIGVQPFMRNLLMYYHQRYCYRIFGNRGAIPTCRVVVRALMLLLLPSLLHSLLPSLLVSLQYVH